ncbi:MAG: sigma 54-interacting transcriptional regulator [Candidatus Binatia bacterium]
MHDEPVEATLTAAEAKANYYRDQYNLLLSQIPNPTFLIDPEQDRILEVNEAACELLGYTRDDLTSKLRISDIHPNEMSLFQEFGKEVYQNGAGQTEKLTCMTSDGRNLPIKIHANLVENRQGRKLIRAIVVDNFARHAVEQALLDEVNSQYNFEEVVGRSSAFQEVLKQVEILAPTDSTVLIRGETGSGKELICRMIHHHSTRSGHPLLKVNCASIPPDLVKSAIFGHEQGAFAGALSQKRGFLELAHKGTILLDEIADICPEIQPKLLRFLQDKEFERIGGTRTIKVDTRVVAATRRDLESKVREGEFLEDLYYRLNISSVTIPPLRARKEDIPLLAKYFADRITARIGRLSVDLSETAVTRLLSYSWPGNIRELSNVIERIVVSTRGSVLEIDEGILGEGVPLGSYRLVEQLGSGGMGEVWLARHKLLARPAAVKLIRPEALAINAQVIERFEREAQVTATLQSPHTVHLYDFGISETGSYYYVMELLTGMDLDSMVKKFGPVSAERTVMLLRQACRSLSEAHEAGLVHRDIKPANLYVCKLGPDYDFLKVLDFGMVKAPIEGDATRLTAIGSATGTPAFIAPELALGDVEVDGRADIYALGCVAYWLLTRMLLFEAESQTRMLMHHIQTRPKPPSEASEIDIPRDLERLIMACLEKAPKDRPSSASELWSMLGEIKFDQPWDQIHAQRWWKLHRPDLVGN